MRGKDCSQEPVIPDLQYTSSKRNPASVPGIACVSQMNACPLTKPKTLMSWAQPRLCHGYTNTTAHHFANHSATRTVPEALQPPELFFLLLRQNPRVGDLRVVWHLNQTQCHLGARINNPTKEKHQQLGDVSRSIGLRMESRLSRDASSGQAGLLPAAPESASPPPALHSKAVARTRLRFGS
jgi:hypothetical protein